VATKHPTAGVLLALRQIDRRFGRWPVIHFGDTFGCRHQTVCMLLDTYATLPPDTTGIGGVPAAVLEASVIGNQIDCGATGSSGS
jgi:hypothetical protein